MRGKLYKAMKEKVAKETTSIEEAVAFLKGSQPRKFDETIEVHINLGVNATKSDQMVRGSVSLPNGTPKKKRVVVITADSAKQDAATKAGAFKVGGEELIAAIIKDGGIEADIVVASPDMMPKIARAAKVLGPKGLMPNPKTGTVTPDVDKAVTELTGGKISFKMDSTGNIHEAVGKVSWDAEKISENIDALLQAVKAARPAAQKGEFLKKIVVKSTMSPAVAVKM